MMLLHAVSSLSPGGLWRAWSFEPGVVVPLLLIAALHIRGVNRLVALSSRRRPALMRESAVFQAGLLILALAMISPLHQLGAVLFSAHMVQHELLMAVAAPLMILGRPAVPMLWGLPGSSRQVVGNLINRSSVRQIWALIANPFSAWLLHAIAIWIWHTPRLYDASVRSELVHSAQHMSFGLTALLFWWSILSPRALRRTGGVGIVSLFTTGLHTTFLGALIATASSPLFSVYTAEGTARFGLTPLDDQQLGGVIMWVPAGMAYLVAALFLFRNWIRESGARVRRVEAVRRTTIAADLRQIAALVVVIASVAACHRMSDAEASELTGGTPARGAEAIRKYGCESCHSIPGIAGANALVGPPLSGIASRSFIAGVLANNPDNMITWIRNPPAVDNKTAMPNMGVTEKDARDISAYLYTLR